MAEPLTTVARVREYLRTSFNDSQAETAERLIRTASRIIRTATGRRFSIKGEEPETREIPTHGDTSVYVDELRSLGDLDSVTDDSGIALPYELEWDENAGERRGVTVRFESAASLYAGSASRGLSFPGYPMDHADLFIRELNPGALSTSFAGIPSTILVTGAFGYEEIPEDVEFAATRTVGLWYKEEIARYTDDAFISRGQQFNPEMLPPITMAMLRGANWIIEEGRVLV